MPIRQTVLGWPGIGAVVRVSVTKSRAKSGRQRIGVDVAQRGKGVTVIVIGNRHRMVTLFPKVTTAIKQPQNVKGSAAWRYTNSASASASACLQVQPDAEDNGRDGAITQMANRRNPNLCLARVTHSNSALRHKGRCRSKA